MNSRMSRRRADRAHLDGHGADPTCRTSIDVFAKARGHERAEQLRAAREADLAALLPAARGPGAARRRDGGRRAHHARLEQLPRADRRRARRCRAPRDALERYGTGLTGSRFLNGTIAAAPRARARARRVDGHRGRARLHDRPPGQHRHARHAARPRRHRHRRLGRPRLDPRRLPALARQAAPVPPQPARQARDGARARGGATAAACSSSSTACSRWRATSPRCPRSPRCARARRAADGRRGPRRRRAGRARRGRRASCSASRTASTCGWARSRSRWPRAAASSPGRPRSSSSCASSRAPSSSPPPACRPRSARRSPRCAIVRSAEGPQLLGARARATPATCATGCASAASRSSSRSRCRAADVVTPIVPVLVGDDWKAALLWRALYDAGVFVNSALHPAVPPGGALLRTSVMATHDRADARPGARRLQRRQGGVRGRARAAAAPPAALRPPVSAPTCGAAALRGVGTNQALFAGELPHPPLTEPRR